MKTKETLVPKLRFSRFEDGWSKTCLGGECSLVTYGLTVRPSYHEQGIPLISAREIKSGKIDLDSAPRISETDFKNLAKKIKPIKGDLFLSKTGSIGFSTIVDQENRFAITQNIAVLRFKPNAILDRTYTLHQMKTVRFLRDAQRRVNQSTIMDLQLRDIKQLEITHSSLPEQEKIAAFLTSVDDRIDQLKRKKTLLQDYKKGVMQKLFAQELRFKDDNGNDYPDWEEKKLGDVGSVYQPQTISQTDLCVEGYPVYGANGIIGNYHTFNHEHAQVAVTCRGSTCGVVNFTTPKSWITGNAMVVNLDEYADETKLFIYYYLTHSDLRYLITGSGQPQITGEIKKHQILLPSLPEQTKIANFLSTLDQKIEQTDTQITQTQTFKKGLLQQMFA